MEIRSFRMVFDLERRIYRVDRLRLNPGGVPVRSVVYFLLIVSVALIAQRVPLLGGFSAATPWYLRDLLLPAAGSAVLSVIRLEGRPFHLAAQALVRYRLQSRCHSGLRPCAEPGTSWEPSAMVFLPDGSDSRMRTLRYTGPGAVRIALQHEREVPATTARRNARARSAPVVVRELPGRRPLRPGQVLALAPRARLLVRRAGTRGR